MEDNRVDDYEWVSGLAGYVDGGEMSGWVDE